MPDSAPQGLAGNKRRLDDPNGPHHAPAEDAFITDHDAAESGGDDDEDDEKPKSDKKAGRRKIKIEFIQDKSRRHITFSKRKAGIMKKAYELSTLTGTQVLLLVVSETGLVYTFTTAKLQPLVTQPEGKNLIQACLNAPHGTLPSSMPVGQPLGRSNPISSPMHHGGPPPGAPNVPGGLAIGSGGGSGKDDEDNDANEGEVESNNEPRSRKRRRASSTSGGGSAPAPASSASAPGSAARSSNPPPGAPGGAPAGVAPGGPGASPHARPQPMPPLPGAPPALSIPGGGQQMPGQLEQHSPRQGQQQPGAQPTSPNYQNAAPPPYGAPPPQGDPNMYGPPPTGHTGYAAPPPYGFTGHDAGAGGPGQGAPGMPPSHAWGPPPVQQNNHYAQRR